LARWPLIVLLIQPRIIQDECGVVGGIENWQGKIEVHGLDWSNGDREHWRPLVNMVMNSWVPNNVRKFMTN
jgi:hypothetical protein